MLKNIIVFVDEGRIDKAMRWLGFVQGVLWFDGQYSIEQLASHNMKKTG